MMGHPGGSERQQPGKPRGCASEGAESGDAPPPAPCFAVRGPAPECLQGSAAPCAQPSPKSPSLHTLVPSAINALSACGAVRFFEGGRGGGGGQVHGRPGRGAGSPPVARLGRRWPGRDRASAPRQGGSSERAPAPALGLFYLCTDPDPQTGGAGRAGHGHHAARAPGSSGHRRGRWPSGSSQAAAPVSVRIPRRPSGSPSSPVPDSGLQAPPQRPGCSGDQRSTPNPDPGPAGGGWRARRTGGAA